MKRSLILLTPLLMGTLISIASLTIHAMTTLEQNEHDKVIRHSHDTFDAEGAKIIAAELINEGAWEVDSTSRRHLSIYYTIDQHFKKNDAHSRLKLADVHKLIHTASKKYTEAESALIDYQIRQQVAQEYCQWGTPMFSIDQCRKLFLSRMQDLLMQQHENEGMLRIYAVCNHFKLDPVAIMDTAKSCQRSLRLKNRPASLPQPNIDAPHASFIISIATLCGLQPHLLRIGTTNNPRACATARASIDLDKKKYQHAEINISKEWHDLVEKNINVAAGMICHEVQHTLNPIQFTHAIIHNQLNKEGRLDAIHQLSAKYGKKYYDQEKCIRYFHNYLEHDANIAPLLNKSLSHKTLLTYVQDKHKWYSQLDSPDNCTYFYASGLSEGHTSHHAEAVKVERIIYLLEAAKTAGEWWHQSLQAFNQISPLHAQATTSQSLGSQQDVRDHTTDHTYMPPLKSSKTDSKT